MNKVQRKRLLNVARACRETKTPDLFTMRAFAHPCGTPACALGNYAARRDLQRSFYLVNRVQGSEPYWLQPAGTTYTVGFDGQEVHEHFGIDYDESQELFGPNGCRSASTGNKAADYIERFVEAKT